MNIIKLPALLAIITLFLVSCGTDSSSEIENPIEYEFLRNGISTVSFQGQTTRISMATELINAMEDMESSEEHLIELFSNQTTSGGDANPYEEIALNESNKSIKSKVAASNDFFSANTVESAQIKDDFEQWISTQVSEVFSNRNQLATPGNAGQIADGSTVRYVSGSGLEYNQAVNKSLIGALMVDQILNNYLSTSVLDEADNRVNNDNKILVEGKPYTNMEHKWDEAYGYLFGAVDADYSNPLSTLGNDDFLNKYLSRVDGDSDFAGIADDLFQAFKLGRAAIVAGEYDVRDKEANNIKDDISLVIAVRAVHYLQQGKYAKENNDMGSAFHDLSEGFGFIYSLRFLRKGNSDEAYFTKSEVDEFLNYLTDGNGFWDVDSAILDQMSSDIAKKFDFTIEQTGS